MADSNKLSELFFKELKQYNTTNFKTLLKSDLSQNNPIIHKACSSVVTRYFIFVEKHPEISETEAKLLYFQLRIDMIARYFSEYPASSLEDLKPFQDELKRFVKKLRDDTYGEDDTSISD